jgi:hypothetical protein
MVTESASDMPLELIGLLTPLPATSVVTVQPFTAVKVVNGVVPPFAAMKVDHEGTCPRGDHRATQGGDCHRPGG